MLGLPTLWATNYRQLEARRRWRGRYGVVNRTLLWRLPLRRFCCGGTICLIPGHERRPAIRRNPPLLLVAEGLLWKLPAKMRKWSAKDLNIVCRIHAFPKALSTTSRNDTLTRHEATRAPSTTSRKDIRVPIYPSSRKDIRVFYNPGYRTHTVPVYRTGH